MITKLGEIDSVLDTIKTDTQACEVSLALLDDLVLAEDSAHSSGQKGIMSLAVRQSSHADLAADGDYIPFTINDDGELRVTTGGSASQTTTHITADTDLATTGSHSSYSIDTGTSSTYCKFYIDTGNTEATDMDVQVSHDNSAWIPERHITMIATTASGGGSQYYANAEITNPPRYVRLYNFGGSQPITIVEGIIVFG